MYCYNISRLEKSDENRKIIFLICFIEVNFFLAILPMFFNLFLYSDFFSGKILSSLPFEQIVTSKTAMDILQYMASVAAVHMIFSLLIYALVLHVSIRMRIVRVGVFTFSTLVNLLVCLWIYSANSIYYPGSVHPSVVLKIPSIYEGDIIYLVLSLLICFSFFDLVICNIRMVFDCRSILVEKIVNYLKNSKILGGAIGNNKKIIVLPIVIVLLILTYISSIKNITASQIYNGPSPNIIIIGIDSLRPSDIPSKQNAKRIMPNLHEYLKNAMVFDKAYTPLARTFPSWMSVLTGTYPVKHKAYFNLISPEEQDKSIVKISSVLNKSGYDTIYATDEKRFSNIDKLYGFDQTIGPPIGAEDFLLGKINDLPLINLLSNSYIGKYLFPNAYGNRAVSFTYKTSSFIDLIENGISEIKGKPTFLCVHLCLPHWPYDYYNGDNYNLPIGNNYQKYKTCLNEVDKQFGKILDLLSTKKLLDNAIVIVLSDHGESFEGDFSTYYSDQIDINNSFSKRQIPGHGTDVLERKQYEVLLSFRSYGAKRFQIGSVQQNASLIDIAPTITQLLKDKSIDEQFDGISLIPWLQKPSEPIKERFFFVESGFSVPAILANTIDEDKAVFQGMQHYRLTNSGRVVIKKESIRLLMSNKQIAVYKNNLTLAFLPQNNSIISNVLIDNDLKYIYDDSSIRYHDNKEMEIELINYSSKMKAN